MHSLFQSTLVLCVTRTDLANVRETFVADAHAEAVLRPGVAGHVAAETAFRHLTRGPLLEAAELKVHSEKTQKKKSGFELVVLALLERVRCRSNPRRATCCAVGTGRSSSSRHLAAACR